MQRNATRSSDSSTPPTSGNMSLSSPLTNSRPSTDILAHSRLSEKKRCNDAWDTRRNKRRKGNMWEKNAKLLPGTAVMKYQNCCLRECSPSPSPVFSDSGVSTSREPSVASKSQSSVTSNSQSSITSNSPPLSPVFSDRSVTTSSESSINGVSQCIVSTSASQPSATVGNYYGDISGNRSSSLMSQHCLRSYYPPSLMSIILRLLRMLP